MPQTQTRVVGSGFSTFNWRGQPIAFLDSYTDTGQLPITDPEPVHPLGSPYPVEVATARALRVGTLRLTIRELWNAPVWWQLAGLNGTFNILDVYRVFANDPNDVTCQMLIKPPTGPWRGKTYHSCLITTIPDDENVTLGALTVPRTIEVMYTHATPLTQAA